MPLSHYVTLGRSGLRVSPFCLGAMTFGEANGWGANVKTSNAMMDRYIDLGGNFIDTANQYCKSQSEKIIGDHIGRLSSKRDRVVISTKGAGAMFPGDPNGGGGNAKNLKRACEESLRRLQTDYIDLYYCHVWDYFTPIDETMNALADLVRSGKVRYIGLSDIPAWKLTQAQMIARYENLPQVIALQMEYSLLERNIESEIVPMAKEMGVGILPWSPLKNGLLSGKYSRAKADQHTTSRDFAASELTEKTFDIIDILIAIGEEHGVGPARVALAWVKSQPGISSVLLGVRTLAQLEENVAALDLMLTPEQLARLDEISKPKLHFGPELMKGISGFFGGGTTINGQYCDLYPGVPSDADRF